MVSKSLEAILSVKNRKDLKQLFLDIDSIACVVDSVKFGDTIKIHTNNQDKLYYKDLAKKLMPWRKGPFQIDELFIDTEWRSFIKYNYIEPFFNLKGKKVADIGANNGYYSFKMLEQEPLSVTIFEPYPPYFAQFYFLDKFINSNIRFELLGVDDLNSYGEQFDVLFCLGVVYHRTDPIGSLKALRRGLADNGELFVDCLIIDGDDEIALCPSESYAKMTNAYFIPTVRVFKSWLARAGFNSVEFLGSMPTTTEEQRSTEWIGGLSLDSFLSHDGKTIEGYQPPVRAYFKCKKERKGE